MDPDMTISRERLYQAVCELHARAEDLHRQEGVAQMMVLLIPVIGPGTLYILPEGMPPAQVLAALVRQASAVGIALSGEVWESAPGINGPTLLGMPFADMPQPSTDPNRREALLTTAVGLGPNGSHKLLRHTRIERLPDGTILNPAVDLKTKIRTDGVAALLTLALQTAGTDSRYPDAASTPDTAAPPLESAQISTACPDCQVPIGQKHTERCCIAWCARTGRQRRDSCTNGAGCRTSPGYDCGATWSGLMPGVAECRQLGWFAVLGPQGWTSAAPETPGAVEDVSRLIAEAVWDPDHQCYRAPHDTDTPDLAFPDDAADLREGS